MKAMCTSNQENDAQMNALNALYRGLLHIRAAQNIQEARELADALHNLPRCLSQLRSNPNDSPETENDLKMFLSIWQNLNPDNNSKQPA